MKRACAFLIIFLLAFSLYSTAFASVGDRHFFGFSGISSTNAFKYRSPSPYTYGQSSTHTFITPALTGAKYIVVERGVHVDISSGSYSVVGIGMKFQKLNSGGTPITPTEYACPYYSTNDARNFRVVAYLESDIADWNNIAPSLATAHNFALADSGSTMSLQPDGTCLLTGISYANTDLPVGDYVLIIESNVGLFFSDMLSPLGNNTTPNFGELVCPSRPAPAKKLDGVSTFYPYYWLNGTDVCSDLTFTGEYISNYYVNFDFFFVEGANLPVAPPPPPANSCNPFSSNFATAFINTDFDLADCAGGFLSYLFSPSDASISQYGDLYTTITNKPPVGYFTATYNLLHNDLNDTGTSAFSLESLPVLNDYIFDPIYTALQWIFWLVFIFIMYHRIKNIDI